MKTRTIWKERTVTQEIQTVKQRAKRVWQPRHVKNAGCPTYMGDRHLCQRQWHRHREPPGEPGRANHGRVAVPPEDHQDGQGAEGAQDGQHSHSDGGCLSPFKGGQPPLEAGGVVPPGPPATRAGPAAKLVCKSPQQFPSDIPTFPAPTSSAPAPGQAVGAGRGRAKGDACGRSHLSLRPSYPPAHQILTATPFHRCGI